MGAVHAERRQVSGSSRFGAHPAQSHSTVALGPQPGAVPGKLQIGYHAGPAAHLESFLDHLEVAPAMIGFVLRGIGRIDVFEIKILLVKSKDGKSPRDMLVV